MYGDFHFLRDVMIATVGEGKTGGYSCGLHHRFEWDSLEMKDTFGEFPQIPLGTPLTTEQRSCVE